jgi:oligopeptidase B
MPLADVPHPPIAPRKPSVHVAHGDTREDDWQWLADKQDRAVVAYLQAENGYADAEMAPTVALQETLFARIRARTAETDISTPVFHEG